MGWQFTDGKPVWQQIKEQMTLRILKGDYPLGGKLPSIRNLAVQAGVNPNTAQYAMAQLEADGLAVGHRTAGRTVTKDTTVIEAAISTRAKSAVAECLGILAELGYNVDTTLAFVKEELSRESSLW